MIDSNYSLSFIGENDTTENFLNVSTGMVTKPDLSLPIQANATRLPTSLGSLCIVSVDNRACKKFFLSATMERHNAANIQTKKL